MYVTLTHVTRRLWVPAFVLLSVAAPSAAQSPSSLPELAVGLLPDDIRIDGRLDEPAWSAAPAIERLTMLEPVEGGEPSFGTTIRVLASPRALVIGIVCSDPEPARIVSYSKARDSDMTRSEDNVWFVLDPFLDGRSGYSFVVNPAGARLDGLIEPGGESVRVEWDAIWDAATAFSDTGWTAEIWIPIQSLAFNPRLTEWAFNIQRRVQRLQEVDRWSSPQRDYEITQTSRAGRLTGLPAFDTGLGLTVRPSLVGGGGIPEPEAPVDGTFEPSLDVTQRLGGNLLTSLSVNTDFAETEVDQRQVNLTRFPLFFPEKRTFFLEGADIFQFGLGLGTDVIPYFSRRIGLVAETAVPIVVGGKINGRVSDTNLGGLVVRSNDVEGLVPDTTVGVMRVKQNILKESSVGMIATYGDPVGRSGSWLAGADFTYQTSSFRGNKNFLTGVWGLVMDRDDLAGDKTAAGFKIDYPNDLWDVALTYFRIGDAFDPSLGFVPRRGINSARLSANYMPRPERWGIRQMFFEQSFSIVTDLGGDWESYRYFSAPINWRFESGDRVEANVVPTGERLVEPFEISPGVVIAPGSYHWLRYRAEVETAAKRRLRAQLTWWFGGFYDGRLDQLIAEGAWSPTSLVTIEFRGEHNIARELSAGDFTETLIGTRFHLNVSPRLQLTSFVQYDTTADLLGTNTRLRWTFHPQGDLFVVYNHNIRDIDDRWRLDGNQLLVKLQYSWRY